LDDIHELWVGKDGNEPAMTFLRCCKEFVLPAGKNLFNASVVIYSIPKSFEPVTFRIRSRDKQFDAAVTL
jgi:hypothetical protein